MCDPQRTHLGEAICAKICLKKKPQQKGLLPGKGGDAKGRKRQHQTSDIAKQRVLVKGA